MKLEKGKNDPNNLELQKRLNQYNLKKFGEGKFTKLKEDGDFGNNTYNAVVKFQQENNLKVDGIVGDNTWNALQKAIENKPQNNPIPSGDPNAPYKNITIEGSTFPGKPYDYNVKITFTKEMLNEYIPALNEALTDAPKGLKMLLTIMAQKEGFYKGTRSYTNNNPGNIGNTDSGANKKLPTLKDGILLQKDYVEKVITGKHTAYPMNQLKVIPPYYSPEIAKNQKTYGINPYLPGYKFIFTGQIDQYVKIYSTGARGGNSYINMIISYFKQNGIDITPDSKIQDIIKIS
jgi:peptidoglycan hydrolase-like protein with peptidoglycan-binding domain